MTSTRMPDRKWTAVKTTAETRIVWSLGAVTCSILNEIWLPRASAAGPDADHCLLLKDRKFEAYELIAESPVD
jgi:hypothetical protein